MFTADLDAYLHTVCNKISEQSQFDEVYNWNTQMFQPENVSCSASACFESSITSTLDLLATIPSEPFPVPACTKSTGGRKFSLKMISCDNP